MKITVEVDNIEEFNFFYNTLMLGTLSALQHGKISPIDGAQLVFSHNAIKPLKNRIFHPSFYHLVWAGSEIEDFDKDEQEEKRVYLENMQKVILENYGDATLKLSSPRGCQMLVQLGDNLIPIIKLRTK